MGHLMQQNEYPRFSSVWAKTTDGRHVGICGKHLRLKEGAAQINGRGVEQTICAMVFRLVKVGEGTRHFKPDSAIAEQANLKPRSESRQNFLGRLRVAEEATTR